MLRLVAVPVASLAAAAPIGLSKVYAAEKETIDSEKKKDSVKYKPSEVSHCAYIFFINTQEFEDIPCKTIQFYKM